MTTTRVNPYVGPRAFRTGETLYGRDREVDELLDLLIAERIVLLYSPSGAGKSSLVQAALIPRLEEEGFLVRPVMRVSQESPSQNGWGSHVNRYIFSLLLSLEEALPEDLQLPLDVLAGLDLPTYLRRSAEADGERSGEALIFDQFEEILTVNPADQEAKAAFFAQVGQALRDRARWALFAMREDYIAGLDRYLRPIPTRLATTFRLDLLAEAAARSAMQQPARQAGVDFTDDAAKKLVNDLRKVRIQRPDGSTEEQLGLYVEPVQLQVVCYRLWEKLPADARQIVEADVEAVGNVDRALSDYYAERVASVAREAGVKERAIREWCEQQLITRQGIRGQVLQGPEQGLDSRAIQRLLDAYLVRAEKRRGATWFELAHDRLIEPVQKNNAEWREAHLSALQRQADLWEKQHRPAGLLLRGQALIDAELWAEAHADELIANERDFLETCRKARAAEQRERRNNRLIRGLAVVALIISVVAFFFFVQAKEQARIADESADQAAKQAEIAKRNEAAAREAEQLAEQRKREADRQADIARSGSLAAQSQAEREKYPQRSLLLALEALSVTLSEDGVHNPAAEQALRDALANIGGRSLTGQFDSVSAAAFSPDSRWLAIAGRQFDSNTGNSLGVAHLWDLTAPDSIAASRVLTAQLDFINAVAFSPDNRWLAIAGGGFDPNTGSNLGAVHLWDLTAPDSIAASRVVTGPAYAVAFSLDNRRLAIAGGGFDPNTGSNLGAVHLWDLTVPDSIAASKVLTGQLDSVYAVAFSPDSRWLAIAGNRSDPNTGSTLGAAHLWDLTAPDSIAASRVLTGQLDFFSAAAFSPDNRWLAIAGGGFDPNTGSTLGAAHLWDLTAPDSIAASRVLTGQLDFFSTTAFSPDSRWLAIAGGGFDPDTGNPLGAAHLWDLTAKDPAATPIVLHGHKNSIYAVIFSPDGRWLVTGSDDTTVRLWDLTAKDPAATPIVLHGHDGPIVAVAISPDNHWLVTRSADSTARLWDLTAPGPVPAPTVLLEDVNFISAIVSSPDSRWLAIAGGGFDPNTGIPFGTAYVWDLTAPDSIAASRVLTGQLDFVSTAFSPDSRWLAIAGNQSDPNTGIPFGTAYVWDLTAPDSIAASRVLTGQLDSVYAVAFSPDSRWLAIAGDRFDPNAFRQDGTAHLWDLTAKDPAVPSAVLRGHEGSIRAIDFSPDNHWLATAGDDNTIRLWDLTTENPALSPIVLRGHEGGVSAVAFSPDNHWLVTVGNVYDPKSRIATPAVRLWTLRVQDLVDRACQAVGRNLTDAEWQQYFGGKEGYHKTCAQWPEGK